MTSRKADREELDRLAAWVAALAAAGIDPFDPSLPLGPPYSPAEQVYFALAGEAEYGDRSAAKRVWGVVGDKRYVGGTVEASYARGFIEATVPDPSHRV